MDSIPRKRRVIGAAYSIDLRQLRFAVMSADTQSFSAAAKACNLKQSTLSRKVSELEYRLGIQLFERSSRGATPTEAGRPFIEKARRILNDLDNLSVAVRAVSYGRAGRVSLGFATSLASGNLRALIGEFITKYEAIQLDAVEHGPDRLIAQLEDGSLDIAVLAEGAPNEGFVVRRLWTERLLVVLSGGHRLLANERIHWNDLRNEVFVLPSGSRGSSARNIVTARLTDQGYRPNILFQTVLPQTIMSMVSAGRFITVIGESFVTPHQSGLHFREIHETAGIARLEISALWRADNGNQALNSFIDLIDSHYNNFAGD